MATKKGDAGGGGGERAGGSGAGVQAGGNGAGAGVGRGACDRGRYRSGRGSAILVAAVLSREGLRLLAGGRRMVIGILLPLIVVVAVIIYQKVR
jgi:hypothetical protein